MPKAYIHSVLIHLPPNLHCGLHDNMAPHLNIYNRHLQRKTHRDRHIPTVSTYLHCQMLSSLLACRFTAESLSTMSIKAVQRNGLFELVWYFCYHCHWSPVHGKTRGGNTIMARGRLRHPVASSRGPASGNGLLRAWVLWLNHKDISCLSSRFLCSTWWF